MKLFYKTEDGNYQEVGGITNAEITFSNGKVGADIDLINCNCELTAQLDKKICFDLGNFKPFDNIKCRTCRFANKCVITKINNRY